MKVSVVMPAFNAAACIGRALASISSQSRAVDQVVVVDDGSTDATVQAVEAWRSSLPLTVVRQPRNSGISAALRAGVEAATSDWVFRLDADDRWESEHVRGLAEAVERLPDAVLATASAHLVDTDGRRLGLHVSPSDAAVRARLMWDNPLIHSASGFSREAYRRAGGYPLGVRWEDYPLWIRLLESGRLARIEDATVEYTVAANSLSRVRREESIRARWVCQQQALRAFWRSNPLAALKCLTLGLGRFAVSRWV